MGQVWPLQMPPVPKSVLISLADNANDQGHCWPSIETICARTCYGRTAVIEAIKWLGDRGYIEADRTNGRKTTYQLTPLKGKNEVVESVKPVRHANQSATRTSPPDGLNQSATRTKPVRQTDTNRKEPSLKSISKKEIAIPDFLPTDAWEMWDSYRAKKSGKGWTAEAKALSIRTLTKLRAEGQDPVALIERSIERNWTTFYPIKDQQFAAAGQNGKTVPADSWAGRDI